MVKDFLAFNDQQELDPTWQKLIKAAQQSLTYAYAPYSSFHVGAALLIDDDLIITGTNQENAAYPSGMCAERVALYHAASRYPDLLIKRLVVVAKRVADVSFTPVTCCGSCRQVMLEYESRQQRPFEVLMLADENRWILAKSASNLLPFAFSSLTLHGS